MIAESFLTRMVVACIITVFSLRKPFVALNASQRKRRRILDLKIESVSYKKVLAGKLNKLLFTTQDNLAYLAQEDLLLHDE
jgi:hypothetical protein